MEPVRSQLAISSSQILVYVGPRRAASQSSIFINQKGQRDVVEPKVSGELPLAVDQRQVGGVRKADPRPDFFSPLDVYRNRDQLETAVLVVLVESLPPGQLSTASSPGSQAKTIIFLPR